MTRESESRQVRVENLRSRMTSLLALTGNLSAEQQELLASTLDELDATVETLRLAGDESRRLLAELTAAHEIVETERERYRDLFQFAPNGYLVTDLNGRIREANRAATNLLNSSLGPPGRVLLSTFVAARDRPTFQSRLERLRRDEEMGEWDIRLVPRGGTAPIDAAVSATTIRNREGRAVGYRWLVRDVTEQKRLQEGLQLLTEASSGLAASLDVAETLPALANLFVPRYADWCLVHIDTTGAGGEAGASSERPLGFQLAAVEARTARIRGFMQSHAEGAALAGGSGPVSQAIEKAYPQLVSGDLSALAAELLTTAGAATISKSLVEGSAITAPLTIRGATVGLLTLARGRARAPFGPSDLQLVEVLARRLALALDNARLYRQARRAGQQAQEREQQLAEFVRMVAHDVQQPLSAANWHVQAMRRALDLGNIGGARLSEEAIEVAIERLDAMIRDLAESARLEMGQARLNFRPTDLSRLVQEIAGQMGEEAGRVRLDLPPTQLVQLDPDRFARVVGNLLSNALKYSNPDTEVLARLREQGNDVILEVSDRGIGITPEDLPRLFERGFRASRAVQKAEGLGMGLYITRLLVEAHHGRIWATSTPGQGSTFYVALPR